MPVTPAAAGAAVSFVTAHTLALVALIVLVTTVWVWSLRARDASLIDLFWGPLFAVQGLVHLALVPQRTPLAFATVALVTLWAARLSVHLARRNLGKGEDPRYAAMRAAGGARWPLRSLVTVFWLQAGLAWAIGLPLARVVHAPAPASPVLAALVVPALVLAGVGFFVEAIADLQLTAFKADPANRGRVLDRGLWRWSRHPNYFGDAVFWWGIWGVAAALGEGWTVFAPVAMTFLLLRVSGVPLLERRMHETRPEYRDYLRRTPPFVPWPSARARRVTLTALASALGIRLFVVPLLDWVGTVLLAPPIHATAARVFVVALWLALVGAAWSYRGPEGPEGSEAEGDRGAG